MKKATIHERGNGLPTADFYVPGNDGELYRIVSIDGRSANYVRATVELADWSDCAEEDVFPASAVID